MRISHKLKSKCKSCSDSKWYSRPLYPFPDETSASSRSGSGLYHYQWALLLTLGRTRLSLARSSNSELSSRFQSSQSSPFSACKSLAWAWSLQQLIKRLHDGLAWLLPGFLLGERLRGSVNVRVEAEGCGAACPLRSRGHGVARPQGSSAPLRRHSGGRRVGQRQACSQVVKWGWRSPQYLLGWHLGREEEW